MSIYNFKKSDGLNTVQNRINAIYKRGELWKKSHSAILGDLQLEVTEPLNYKYRSGKFKHSTYLRGFALGVQLQMSQDLLNKMEYCYLLHDGLYSTNKESMHKSIELIYKTDRVQELSTAQGNFYYPNSTIIYF
jgi:UDP-N-acetylenolpyruvoylglucosamine reductase